MTQCAIDSQATAQALIDHFIRKGAVVVEERNEAERLRLAVERSRGANQRQEISGVGSGSPWSSPFYLASLPHPPRVTGHSRKRKAG